MAEVRVKLCEHGDVFVWIDGQMARSPYAENEQGEADAQIGFEFTGDSLVEVAMLMLSSTEMMGKHKHFQEWLSQVRTADRLLLEEAMRFKISGRKLV